MTMRWFEIKSQSEDARNNVFKSMREQKLLVRRENGRLVACIGSQHQGWLTKVCGDFGSTLKVLDNPPDGMTVPKKEEYKVPCDEVFYDPRMSATHQKYCAKCRKLKAQAQAEKPTAEKPTAEKPSAETTPAPTLPASKTRLPVIAKLEPGQDLSIEGVILSLEVTKERLQEQLIRLDSLIENLKGFKDSKDMLSELDIEVKQRVAAVKLLMSDGVIK